MTKRTRTRQYDGIRTDEDWQIEEAYILAESLIATPKTLAKRRRIIERTSPNVYPLNLMDVAVIWDADCTDKPEQWMPVGTRESRPLAWLPRRSYYEWYWLRGREPQVGRPGIPRSVGRAVIERDWPFCQLCGGEIALGEHHLDHIIPFSQGGPETVGNLRLAHDLCNIARGAGRDG